MSLASVLLGAAAKTKVSPRFAPFFSQAANEALVRFGPQWDVLNLAREQSAQDMRQRMAQANVAGAMMADAANRSVATLAHAPAISVNYAGPAGGSAQVTGQALGSAREGTIGMLATSARNAPIMASQQALQARAAHEQDLAKIQGQRASLAGQIGAYTTGRIGDLIGSDRKMRHDANQAQAKLDQELALASQRDATTRRGQTLSHEDRQASVEQRRQAAADRKNPKPKPGQVPNPGNIPLLAPAQQATQVARINTAYANVKDLMGKPNAQKHEVELLLRAGKVDGVKYTQPQIDVAFDLLRNKGRVSNRGAHRLHTIGVSVGGHFHPARPRTPSISTGLGSSLPLPPGVQS